MPQSLSTMLIHMIFSTKNRVPFLDAGIRAETNAYLVGVLRNLSCPSIITNSEIDHVHSFFSLSRTQTISNIAKALKEDSSQWLKTKGPDYACFSWQKGYGAFSVSPSNVNAVKEYIANQAEHHRQISFKDEFRLFLQEHAIEWDEKYVWD